MNKMLKTGAVAALMSAAALLPTVAHAQALPAAVIVIVDMDEVYNGTAAGKQASIDLKTKLDAIQARATTLRTQFGSEEETLGKSQPAPTDTAARPAWENKVRDYQARRQAAEAELGNRDKEFQASRAYVLKQITDASTPVVTAIMRERGATIAMPEGATLQHAASVDITTDVIARINKALPRVSITPPAAPAVAK